MRLVFPLVLGSLVSVGGASSPGDCRWFSPRLVGEHLGDSLLQMTIALAKSDDLAPPKCEPSESEDKTAFCRSVDDFGSALEELNTALDEGCLNEERPYDVTCEFHAFRLLKESLEHADPRRSWHQLKMMYALCSDPGVLTEAGTRGCRRDVEEAALMMLQLESEPLLRRLALEILASGYVSDESRTCLEEIVHDGSVGGDSCQARPLLTTDFTGETFSAQLVEHREMDRRCEPHLARTALSLLEGGGR